MVSQSKQFPIKGRGAVSNMPGRFQSEDLEAFDDGWGNLDFIRPAPLKTQVFEDQTKSIVSKNQSPDIPFDLSINPYKGCEHGCIYCYARQTHAYLDLSPGLDFETKIFKKKRAGALLEAFFRKKNYICETICIGSNTDPYQPVEKKHEITRSLLQVFLAYQHPVALITKSALILRDLDLLSQLAKNRLVKVMVSITSLDPNLAHKLEPRAAAPGRRLEVVEQLTNAGVPTGVMAAPMIPALNDAELEAILEAAATRKAESAGYILVRLPFEVKDLFKQWLSAHYPDRAKHVMSLIQQSRNGKDYEAGFGKRMRGQGPYASMLQKRFDVAIKRLGLAKRGLKLNTQLFKPPPQVGDQLSLFS